MLSIHVKKDRKQILKDFAALLDDDEGLRKEFDDFLEEQLTNDAFGTEGQNDPRGDHRDES